MESTPEAWIVSMTIRDIETTDNLSDCGIYQQVEAITGNKMFEIMNKGNLWSGYIRGYQVPKLYWITQNF